jgi:hypothetical protein
VVRKCLSRVTHHPLCYNFARTICHYVFESVKSIDWKRVKRLNIYQ